MAIDQITTGVIKDNAVTAAKIPAGAVDADVGTGAITTAKLAADAVDGTKLADNAVNSEHYTDGSIDLAHMSADSVDGTKIVDNAINSEHYTDGSIDTAHIADDQVTGAKIENNPTIAGNLTVAGDLIPVISQLSHRNMIINGDMMVQQRGQQSHAAGTEKITECDRFGVYSAGGTVAVDSKNSSCGSGMTDGFTQCLWIDVTTADTGLTATDRLDIFYKFEGRDVSHWRKGLSNALPVTLSFWIKSPKTGVHIVELYDTDNSRSISKSYTVSAANTWEKHAVTFPGDTTGAFANDTNKSLELHFWLLAGSNFTSNGTLQTSWAAAATAKRAVGQVNCMDNTANNIMLTGVQLELGSNATPFEFIAHSEQLRRCRRYFQKINGIVGSGYQNGNQALIVGAGSVSLAHGNSDAVLRDGPTISGTFASASLGSCAGNAEFASNAVSGMTWGTSGSFSLSFNSNISANGANDNSVMGIYYNGRDFNAEAEL